MSELINNNQKARQEKLKALIKRLHKGEDFETVKQEFAEEFGSVSTEEISRLEQALVEEGMDVEEIQKLCDVHADIMGTAVEDIHGKKKRRIGHPLQVLEMENERIERLIDEEIVPYLKQEGNHAILMLRVGFDRLNEVKKHYARKEQLFFPYLEEKGVTAPPRVMWGVDDEIREKLNAVRELLNQEGTTVADVKEQAEAAIKQIRDMVFKENNILIPLLEEKLTLIHFIKIAESSDEIGYFLEAPEDEFTIDKDEDETEEEEESGEIPFTAGKLSAEEADAIMNTLPLDVTFVDKDGHVKYFSQGKERIFDRPKTILGRHVNMCHPPSSVHIVEKIVENFKSGKKDVEDFWIQFKGMFVHIRYFAIRNRKGEYLGTLETTQNIKPLRELEGEKRIMDSD